jgi:hypothetical protein
MKKCKVNLKKHTAILSHVFVHVTGLLIAMLHTVVICGKDWACAVATIPLLHHLSQVLVCRDGLTAVKIEFLFSGRQP